ncbi:MAG: TonB-dependent receptor [Zoogloea sp.]|nr:TonB-dependent receptor [Zoogloea sp.]
MAIATLAAQSLAIAQQQSDATAPAAPAAKASEPRATQTLPDVVITAEKRGSTVQRTPISMIAVTGLTLEEKGISSAATLARETAGVSIKSQGAGLTEYTMRGMSSAGGVAATTGLYLDEIAVSPPSSSSAGKIGIDPDLYDLARVEVLRGPQGTLYGASSMGGTIKLVPEPPVLNILEGSAQARASQTQGGGTNGAVSAMVNVPVSKDLAALRLVLSRRHDSGWIDRVVSPSMPAPDPSVTGSAFDAPRGDVTAATPTRVYRNVNSQDLTQVRLSALIKPSAQLTITPSLLDQRTRFGGQSAYDETPGTAAHYSPFDVPEPIRIDFRVASLKVNYEFDSASLVSVTSHIRQRIQQRQDSSERIYRALADFVGMTSFDPGAGGIGASVTEERNPTRQWSQEVRLTSKGESAWRWLVGAYYSDYESSYEADSSAANGLAVVGTDNMYSAALANKRATWALFGNIAHDLTPKLRVTAGARVFSIRNESTGEDTGLFSVGLPPDQSSSTDKGVNPMLNVAYTFNNDAMAYITAAKGFREGAGQRGVPRDLCAADLAALGIADAPHQFKPDTVWSYELGTKNRFFDRALTVNAAVYELRWAKVQQFVTLPTCGFAYTDNAADARVRGAELEVAAQLGGGLSLEQSVGYTHARYSTSNSASGTNKGDKLPGVPTWTSTSSLRYATAINDEYSLLGRLSAVYVGAYEGTAATTQKFGGYTMVNLRLSLQASAGWDASLFVQNLTNKDGRLGFQNTLSLYAPGTDRVVHERPRTVGAELSYRF